MDESYRKTLVIGATGRIGLALRVNWPTGAAIWQARQTTPGYATCDPIAQPDVLAGLAAQAHTILCLAGVVPAMGQTADFSLNSTLATTAIAAAAPSGARVMLCSSAAVYGHQSGALSENAPLCPVGAYGVSKAQMETEAQALSTRLGVQTCVLRIGNVAGFDAILGGWSPGFELDQFPDGRTPRRSYIGLETLARTLFDLAQADTLPGCLNIAEPAPVAMGDLLDAAGLAWQARPAPDTAIPSVELDVSALGHLTGAINQPADPARLVREWRSYQEKRAIA